MVVVLIAGGHASGKRTTAQLIRSELVKSLDLAAGEIEIVDMASYTNQVAVEDHAANSAITVTKRDFKPLKPSRFDFEQLRGDIAAIGAKVVLVHGLYALYDKDILDMSQMKVFISGDADTRLVRWIYRDIIHAAQPVELKTVINGYLHGAKQEMSDFIFPTKERADVIMPRGAEPNAVALIVDGIRLFLGMKGRQPIMLRPSENDLQSERFDNEGGMFYDLT